MLIVAFSKQAQRTLNRLPSNKARLIRAKIGQYALDPDSLAGQVKVLRGYDGIKRLRVGNRRVLFTEDGVVLTITRTSRQSAYEP